MVKVSPAKPLEGIDGSTQIWAAFSTFTNTQYGIWNHETQTVTVRLFSASIVSFSFSDADPRMGEWPDLCSAHKQEHW